MQLQLLPFSTGIRHSGRVIIKLLGYQISSKLFRGARSLFENYVTRIQVHVCMYIYACTFASCNASSGMSILGKAYIAPCNSLQNTPGILLNLKILSNELNICCLFY